MEADPAPPQSAQAASRLHQPQRVSSHAGLTAALPSRQPGDQWTPDGYRGDVIRAGIGSFALSLFLSLSLSMHNGVWLGTDRQRVHNCSLRVLNPEVFLFDDIRM